MAEGPSTNGSNGDGRDAQGRFAAGNTGGPGNPYARETARLRRLIREAVSDEDLREIVRGMVQAAKGGDLAAAKELLNRLVGKPRDAADPDESEPRQPAGMPGSGCSGMTPDPGRAEEMLRHRAELRAALIADIQGTTPVEARPVMLGVVQGAERGERVGGR